MSVRTQIEKEAGLYFITITCAEWIPLFEIADAYSSVFNWFDYLKREGNHIAAFVIMPNHLHCIIEFANASKSVNQFVSNGKRFMAYEIVKKLEEKNLNATAQTSVRDGEAAAQSPEGDFAAIGKILAQLQSKVNNTQRSMGKKHEVFEPSFDCKRCVSNEFTLQKLNYLHNNPVKGKWNLVDNPIDYKYSSMKQYEGGVAELYEVSLIQTLEHFSFL